MKLESVIFKGLALMTGFFAMVACDSDTSDDPAEPPQDDTFIPYQGPVTPLSPEVRPVLTAGKRWVYETVVRKNGKPAPPSVWTFFIDGDSVLYGQKAVVVTLDCNSDFKKCFREENGIVYQFFLGEYYPFPDVLPPNYGFQPIFNILPTASDEINTGLEYLKVLSRGTITLMGKELRAVKLWANYSGLKYFSYEYWVESIGILLGTFPDYAGIRATPDNVLYRRLLQCYDGDVKIYDYREFNEDLYKPVEVFYDGEMPRYTGK